MLKARITSNQNATFITPHWTLLLLLIATVVGVSSYDCDRADLYLPCKCSNDIRGIGLTCQGLNVDDITSVFQRALPINKFTYIELLPRFTGTQQPYDIPSKWLANKKAELVSLTCESLQYAVTIHPLAFGNDTSTGNFSISNCNLIKETRVEFLSALGSVGALSITNCVNIQGFQNFYGHAGYLEIAGCTGLGDIVSNFPNGQSIFSLNLPGNQLTDGQASSLVDRLAQVGTLTTYIHFLGLPGNRLTAVPANMVGLRLFEIDFSNNSISVLQPFSMGGLKVLSVNLDNSGITTVLPNTFRGDYASAKVSMRNNRLVKFEESAFKDLLGSISKYGKGLDVAGNPFDCQVCGDDGLAWLIRDNRDLLPALLNARCPDGTSFADLDPNSCSNGSHLKICTNTGSDGCTGKANGDYAYSSGCCANFYACSSGNQYYKDCVSGLAYDPVSRVCNWPERVSACQV